MYTAENTTRVPTGDKVMIIKIPKLSAELQAKRDHLTQEYNSHKIEYQKKQEPLQELINSYQERHDNGYFNSLSEDEKIDFLNKQSDVLSQSIALHKEFDEITENYNKENTVITLKSWADYKKKLESKPEKVFDDVKTIVKAITKEDFLSHLDFKKLVIQYTKDTVDAYNLDKETADREIQTLENSLEPNFHNCYNFICSQLVPQLNVINTYGLDPTGDRLREILTDKVSLWYVKEKPQYELVPQNKVSSSLATINSRNLEIDPYTGTGLITVRDVQFMLSHFSDSDIQYTVGVNAHKLLTYASNRFISINDGSSGAIKHYKVSFPLKEYAFTRGYDVYEKETSSPEEAKAEKKRVKRVLDQARKDIKNDLIALRNAQFSTEDTRRGQPYYFRNTGLLGSVEIDNGIIKMEFVPTYAQYLALSPKTHYPTELYSIDGRNQNAYIIALKMSEQYFQYRNIERGTRDRLQVSTILSWTQLPTYETLKKQRGSWQDRIKEPLEKCLDDLMKLGVLETWEYTHSKGIPLTDEEAYSIDSYSTFEELYIKFRLKDAPDQAEQIENWHKNIERKVKRNKKRITSTKKQQ